MYWLLRLTYVGLIRVSVHLSSAVTTSPRTCSCDALLSSCSMRSASFGFHSSACTRLPIHHFVYAVLLLLVGDLGIAPLLLHLADRRPCGRTRARTVHSMHASLSLSLCILRISNGSANTSSEYSGLSLSISLVASLGWGLSHLRRCSEPSRLHTATWHLLHPNTSMGHHFGIVAMTARPLSLLNHSCLLD